VQATPPQLAKPSADFSALGAEIIPICRLPGGFDLTHEK
jgi:hypothetical protein